MLHLSALLHVSPVGEPDAMYSVLPVLQHNAIRDWNALTSSGPHQIGCRFIVDQEGDKGPTPDTNSEG